MSKRALRALADFNGKGSYYLDEPSAGQRRLRRSEGACPTANALEAAGRGGRAPSLEEEASYAAVTSRAVHNTAGVPASRSPSPSHGLPDFVDTAALFGSSSTLGASSGRALNAASVVGAAPPKQPLISRMPKGSAELHSLFDDAADAADAAVGSETVERRRSSSSESFCATPNRAPCMGLVADGAEVVPRSSLALFALDAAPQEPPDAGAPSCSVCLMPVTRVRGSGPGGGSGAAAAAVDLATEATPSLLVDDEDMGGGGGATLTMPCCGCTAHVACLAQCVQLRAIRKHCCACQAPFSAAVHAELASAGASVSAARREGRQRLHAALAAGLETLLQGAGDEGGAAAGAGALRES